MKKTVAVIGSRGAIGNAVRFDPTKPVFNGSQYDGYYAWIDPASGNQYAIGAPTNPLALLNLVDDNSDVERIITNLKLDYDLPMDGLKATVNLAYDDASSDGSRSTSELIPTFLISFWTFLAYSSKSLETGITVVCKGEIQNGSFPA